MKNKDIDTNIVIKGIKTKDDLAYTIIKIGSMANKVNHELSKVFSESTKNVMKIDEIENRDISKKKGALLKFHKDRKSMEKMLESQISLLSHFKNHLIEHKKTLADNTQKLKELTANEYPKN